MCLHPVRRITIACAALLVGSAVLSGCSQVSPRNAEGTGNPFAQASTLDFQAPDFSRISTADFQPALEEGMRRQIAEIGKIADNPAPPTFDNTIVALERSGAMLERTMAVFGLLAGADTTPALQEVQQVEAPKLAAHQDAIFLNARLFARIEALHGRRDQLGLDAESRRLLEYDYQQFVHNGARLSDADKTTLKGYNQQLSTLATEFDDRLLAADKAGALVVDNQAELAGLPPDEIAAAGEAAKARGLAGKWVIPLQNTTQQPALSSLGERDVRHELFERSWNRTGKGDANDTRQLIAEMARLRAQAARLLGFDSYAAWKLDDQMARTPGAVMDFLKALAPPAVARAGIEAAARQATIDRERKASGKPAFTLEPWDWTYYGEQVRKAKYDLDAAQLKPYFELNRVLEDGVFHAATRLYGVTFRERRDLPVWEPDVRVFEVFNADGSPLALFYADYFKRDNKRGGAWMSNLVVQSKLLGLKPVVFNVANFARPAPGEPALLSFDDVTTMFHEFGHALNGMFSDTEYPSLSGTVPQLDFVEFPSQFNEHWALYPSVLANYAKHYRTGEPIPAELVAKLKQSQLFNKGYDMTELISAALLDMSWHLLPASTPEVGDVDAFETRALEQNNVDVREVPPRYRSTYFAHIWGGDYAAGYYAYLWTQMLADDAFGWFDENGGLTRANGDRLRSMVLSRGDTEDLARLYREWRGRAPTIDAMKKNRGLAPPE